MLYRSSLAGVVLASVMAVCAAAPAHAFTMVFDEGGSCVITVGTGSCSGALAGAPLNNPVGVTGNVLTFMLPAKVFTGEALVLEADGTISDVLQWYCSTGAGTCGTLMDATGTAQPASDRMVFYSLDSLGALADVGPRSVSFGSTTPTVLELVDGTFSFPVPNGTNTYDGISAGTVPLPAALPLFAGGLGALGLLGWRRKRRAAAAA